MEVGWSAGVPFGGIHRLTGTVGACTSALLLAEPIEGLAPLIVAQVGAMIEELAKKTTVSLAEQDLGFALRYADRCYVIEKGVIRHEAASEALRENPEVIERYLSV